MEARYMESVKIWEEQVMIPTYEIGEADKNPMFLEKRVYQGSCGKVYPYPTIEKISQVKTEKRYRAVYLENEYIKVMVLPEIGGRIQRAYDKTNDYDFVYYNRVIKPALVGLAGPWISGGIEFNWPQHHRPTTFLPVDYMIRENADGSKSLLVNDVDQMYGTKGIAKFTLYPGRAYIEIEGQLYNRTPLAQTFLWWANPAVAVNEYTQSIFPPDVHCVMDHGKRDVSRFPIAKGVYYKHDYSEGIDISRYKNIPVPTSYMAEKSAYDFVGGYDYQKQAGILHVADHHISPGKKQWTWGCGEFGKAWDRNLTDEDGPYIELMTGVYTDNQPDFTWLKPFEEKTFKQYFMPYKQVGAVKNASIHAVLNSEMREGKLYLCVYGTKVYTDAKVVVKYKGKVLEEIVTNLSPNTIYEGVIVLPPQITKESELFVEVCHGGKVLVAYQAQEPKIGQIAKPAEAAKQPQEIMTNEELFLTAQHIEQYRHATYLPDSYYLEGLKRDAKDIRINNAYGCLLMRRGNYKEAETHFNKAIERLTWKNPNPYDSEAYYNLGLVQFYQRKYDEAFDAFYKATWSNEQQEMSFYFLAVLAMRKGDLEDAMAFIDKALIKNSHNIKARGVRACLLRKLGQIEEARQYCEENLEIDGFDYVSRYEQIFLETDSEKKKNYEKACREIMRGFQENYLQTARDYAEAGNDQEAVRVLEDCKIEKPMIAYYQGYYMQCMGKEGEALALYERAETLSPIYCFPNKLEDMEVLEAAIQLNDKGAKAYYYLGNLYYDKMQYEEAARMWEISLTREDTYPTVYRNLALAYFNKQNKPELAKEMLERAYALDETDARVFFELDQLYKKLGVSFEKRLENYNKHQQVIEERDDVLIEYITLHNLLGYHQQAYDLIMSHVFRPWEGAEGKITTQYKIALLELAKQQLASSNLVEARELLEKALVYPENLGEGRLEGTKDNHLYYYLGIVYQQLEEMKKAEECFVAAQQGSDELAGAMYYNDQPADMMLYRGLANAMLGKRKEANACFNQLLDYGEKHLMDEVKIDYFAVSLPDFLIFEDDLTIRNKAHCYYLMGLAKIGFGQCQEAVADFKKVLTYDYNHQNSRIYEALAQQLGEGR